MAAKGHGIAEKSGILFGPNPSGKKYISVFIHRGTRSCALKSKWNPVVLPRSEYKIFCTADAGIWSDATGNYWGVNDKGKKVLGCRGERLCKFPRTNNNNPWHGYPVSPLENGDNDAPSDDLVEKWIAENVVSKTVGRRIQRRKI